MTYPFENKTDSAIRRLAGRSLQADRRRNFFVLLTVSLTTALLSGSLFLLSAGQRKLEDEIRGQYQAVVVNLSPDRIDALCTQPEVERYGISQTFGSCRYEDTVLSVNYSDPNWMELGKKPEVLGTLPEKEHEILVERAFLDYFGLPQETGQTLRLNLDGQEQEYTITGILQAENSSRYFQVEVSRSYAEARMGSELLFEFRLRYRNADQMELHALKEEIAAFLIRNGISEDQIFYSSNYFDMAGFRATKLGSFYPIGLLILLGCSLVVYSIFYISVKGKIREYGRLKVIGATPRQIRRIVRREGRTLSLLAIPFGILLGGIGSAFGSPAYFHFLSILPHALLVACAVELMILLSIHTPVRMAAAVSPIEAVRMTAYQMETRRKDTRQTARPITPASLARMNFDRSRKKTVLTLLSLGLTGILLLAAATVLNSIDPYRMATATMGDGCNYRVSWEDTVDVAGIPDAARNNPLTPALKEQLLELDEIRDITAYSMISAEIALPSKPDAFAINALDRDTFLRLLPSEAMEEGTSDYDRLTAENGVVITDNTEQFLKLYWDYIPEIGDTLELKTYDGEDLTVTVMGIAKKDALISAGIGATMFTVTDDVARKLYPDIENMENRWNVHTTEDHDALRKTLFSILQDPMLVITTRQDAADAYTDFLKNTASIAYLLLGFFFLFSLVSLINTLMTGLLSRQQEFGILQSVGMTGRQLSSMLSMECLCYILATLAITLTAGTGAGALLVRLMSGFRIFGTLVYRFPVIPVLVFAAALFAIQFAYSSAAARYVRRLPLAERIRMMD